MYFGGVRVVQQDGEEPRYGKASQDPDVLRELVKQARGGPRDVQHITGTEIKALKNTSQKAAAVNVSITRMISGFFSGIFGALFGLFRAPVKKRTQCQMYGHVRPSGSWSGAYPKCVECGESITSEEELRGSSARR